MGENPCIANVFVHRVTSLTRPRIHWFLGKQVEETISIGLSFKMFGQTFEARESSTPMRYKQTPGSKMINENAGVKHSVFTFEGVKKRRRHRIGEDKKESHDEDHD